MNRFRSSQQIEPPSRKGLITAAALATAAATAVWVEVKARHAERDNPPAGEFLDIDGIDLHYVERGEGPPVVFLHGNTVTHADFIASGLMDRLALNHRVIAFDRPGFGHSTRPRDRLWTPAAQADLFCAALERLGVEKAVVIGHSMGTLVAMAMALDHPEVVRSLVMIGGYFYPGFRVDALLTAPVALPVVGDVMRYTVTAVSGRLMLGKVGKALFSPQEVPDQFFPVISREMMLRPVQLRANAEDAAFMIPAAMAMSKRYGELAMPVTLIGGEKDLIIETADHSGRLHDELPESELHVVPEAGHMVHYMAHDLVVNAIDRLQPTVSLDSFTDMTQGDLTLPSDAELGRR
jgi:pimeloyl-ACP methyl ester carboxylesterase